ncbi:MAG: MFS transporter [Bacteroidaceae bacterium]|nr:MFS transporter [Bacteroidaceae bacterium]
MLYFSFMLLMPLFPLYLRDTFGANKETIGIVLSGYTLAALFIRPISGYLVDSFPRKVILLLFYALFVAISAGYLIATSIAMFAIFRTLHGIPFGATTVAGTTMAVDVLHPTRRAEGIGYYGLSNNIATAISPTIAIWLLHFTNSYTLLFWLSIIISFIGVIICSTIHPTRNTKTSSPPLREELAFVVSSGRTGVGSLNNPPSHEGGHGGRLVGHFFLLRGWPLALTMVCFSMSYGVISTYVAIYAAEELDIKEGAGIFFFLLAGGLALSRLTGARGLRRGRIVHNASEGMLVSLIGYFLFAAVHHPIALYASALIIGLGNGHMYPAYQNMFINLATNNQRGTANSTLLTSWDSGMGLGVLFGGILAEAVNYHASFWMMWIANLTGVLLFFLFARQHYQRNYI